MCYRATITYTCSHSETTTRCGNRNQWSNIVPKRCLPGFALPRQKEVAAKCSRCELIEANCKHEAKTKALEEKLVREAREANQRAVEAANAKAVEAKDVKEEDGKIAEAPEMGEGVEGHSDRKTDQVKEADGASKDEGAQEIPSAHEGRNAKDAGDVGQVNGTTEPNTVLAPATADVVEDLNQVEDPKGATIVKEIEGLREVKIANEFEAVEEDKVTSGGAMHDEDGCAELEVEAATATHASQTTTAEDADPSSPIDKMLSYPLTADELACVQARLAGKNAVFVDAKPSATTFDENSIAQDEGDGATTTAVADEEIKGVGNVQDGTQVNSTAAVTSAPENPSTSAAHDVGSDESAPASTAEMDEAKMLHGWAQSQAISPTQFTVEKGMTEPKSKLAAEKTLDSMEETSLADID